MIDCLLVAELLLSKRMQTLKSTNILFVTHFIEMQMALSIKPNFSQSLNNLGVVYTVQVRTNYLYNLGAGMKINNFGGQLALNNFNPNRVRWMQPQA